MGNAKRENSPAPPFVSVIIDNYNSEKYLKETIESALEQDYPPREIIVIDDGSKDGSREIILSFGEQVIPLFKENGGQNSALNAGVARSRGEILFFLDGDDLFLPGKITEMVKLYQQINFREKKALVFHRLEWFNEKTNSSAIRPIRLRDIHRKKIKEDFARLSTAEKAYDHARKYGFLPFLSSATSGTSMTASLAREVFPLPEGAIIISDSFFVLASLLLGEVYGTIQVLGQFRFHGKNASNWVDQMIYTKEFVTLRDGFLNEKLQKRGKKPVISYYDSKHARTYYRKHLKSPLAILRLAFKVPLRYPSWDNLYFSLKTILLSVRIGLSHLFGKVKKISQERNKKETRS